MSEVTRKEFDKANGDLNKIPIVQEAMKAYEIEQNTAANMQTFADYVTIENEDGKTVKIFKPTIMHNVMIRELVSKFDEGDFLQAAKMVLYVLSQDPEKIHDAFPVAYRKELTAFGHDLTKVWFDSMGFCLQFDDLVLVETVATLMQWHEDEDGGEKEPEKKSLILTSGLKILHLLQRLLTGRKKK